ncbi:MAG: sugar ABC transporter substrate-binding protein [Solirubrobacterales bacterium]
MALAALFSACGGGSSSSSSSSTSEATEGSSGGSSTAALKEAEQYVAEYQQVPQKIGLTEPLKKLPTGATVYYLQCGVPSCKQHGDGFEEASKILGLNFKRVDAGTDPSTAAKAMETAVNGQADAVVSSGGFPAEIYKEQMKTLESRGAIVMNMGGAEPAGPEFGWTWVVQGPEAWIQYGKLMADYAAVKMGGSGKLAWFNLPEISAFAKMGEGLVPEFERVCPDCEIETEEAKTSEVGSQLPQQVVSYLQRNPDTKYIAFALGAMQTGVDPAIQAAGVGTDVKTFGYAGDASNWEEIKKGSVQAADVAIPNVAFGWFAADAVSRLLAGQEPEEPAPGKFPLPSQILEAKDLTFDLQEWPGAPNYKEEFEELWGV